MIPYKTDTNISSYIIFPRFLIPLDLSNDAKVLYALLLDRAGISRKKGYIEADGTIRLYFTVEDAKAKLRRSRQVATRVFHELENLLEAPMIRKDYRVYDLPEGRRLECSCVDRGTPTEFWYAEVEFPTLEDAYAFTPPAFLGRDVTEEAGYGMSSYWERKVAAQRAASEDNA